MSQHKSKSQYFGKRSCFAFYLFYVVGSILAAQLINGFPIFAYDLEEIGNALSEGGQICPLESECDKRRKIRQMLII